MLDDLFFLQITSKLPPDDKEFDEANSKIIEKYNKAKKGVKEWSRNGKYNNRRNQSLNNCWDNSECGFIQRSCKIFGIQ